MATISLEGLRRTFGEVVAVDGVELEIADGSFTVLLGPSGCGKTTTLNMVAGLEDVSAGRILFDGIEVQDLPPNKRDIAMVFQSYALYPNKKVSANIAFPLRSARVPRAEVAERVSAVAARLGLEPLLDRYPRELSGGQQQRVALGRAMVRRPRAFLLDEPLSNLDAKLRMEMRTELKALQQEIGATFLHVTHDQSEAMSLADVVVVMSEGRIQQAAPPGEVYRRPANRFVAGFVGTPAMNFVNGTIAEGLFRAPGWELPVGSAPSGDVTLGVRCEDVAVEPARGAGSNARVRVVELLGAETIVELELEAGGITARVPGESRLSPGDRVAIEASPSAVHLFHPASGERLETRLGEPSTTSA